MGTRFEIDYLAAKAVVNVKLDDKAGAGMNGSVILFKDEASVQAAAKLMGRKGPGNVELTGQKYKFAKNGGGELVLYGIHYDNVVRDEKNQDKTPTPAEVFEAEVPTISVMAKEPGGDVVKNAIREYLVKKAAERKQG